MLNLNCCTILIYFTLFLFLLVTFGPKTFTFTPQLQHIFATNFAGRRVMSILTQWVSNDPGKALLVHCLPHAMDESGPAPVMAEWYFAYRTCTSILRGSINDRPIVVKVWRGAHMRTGAQVKFAQKLSRELDAWKRASAHPNVAPFLGVMSGFGHLPSLVQPFYKHGNINEYLAAHPETDSLYMLTCVADALAFMHKQTPPIVHGGIRGTNILISDSGTPQLSDVSTCTMPQAPDLTYIGGEFLGTRWMAPEILDPPEPEPGMCYNDDVNFETPQSDVYSFGMTILEILSGRHPFAHRRLHAGVIFDVMQGIRPPRPESTKINDPLWDLIQSCWAQNPQERPDMSTVSAWMRLIWLGGGEE